MPRLSLSQVFGFELLELGDALLDLEIVLGAAALASSSPATTATFSEDDAGGATSMSSSAAAAPLLERDGGRQSFATTVTRMVPLILSV